jgi:hypothetical protein
MIRSIGLLLAVYVAIGLAAFEVLAETANPGMYTWTEEFAGLPLDLDGYRLTFSDEFDEQTVTVETGKGPWFAPVHSDIGASTFDRPIEANQTYTIRDGVLTIRATQADDGKWHAGNIQTVDTNGTGFAQQYGYFEARMKFPAAPGAWCAFWLKAQAEHWNRALTRPEIDVIEWYGGDVTGHHRTVHLWPARAKQFITPGRLAEHWWLSNFSRHDELAGNWHTYGALITPELVIVYLDRQEVGRFPTFDEFKTPLYPLVTLTLYEKDLAKAVSPIDMAVDYVRVYARDSTPLPPAELDTP